MSEKKLHPVVMDGEVIAFVVVPASAYRLHMILSGMPAGSEVLPEMPHFDAAQVIAYAQESAEQRAAHDAPTTTAASEEEDLF